MKNITLIKDKDTFISYAKEHTIPEIAREFGLDNTYVKNYLSNHKIPYKKLWHGFSNHRVYKIYQGMIARCYNPKHVYYSYYGGRGIEVCTLWKNDRKEFFSWAMNNGYSDGLLLDRIDNNGDYCPENCRWVDKLTQGNNKCNNRKVMFGDKLLSLMQIERLTGIDHRTIGRRLDAGWTVEQATQIKPRYGNRIMAK